MCCGRFHDTARAYASRQRTRIEYLDGQKPRTVKTFALGEVEDIGSMWASLKLESAEIQESDNLLLTEATNQAIKEIHPGTIFTHKNSECPLK